MSRIIGRRVLLAISLLYVVVVVRCAWVTEDAYIAFRTVDNLVHGYGLRWNIDERVQTYTCPLWVLLYAPVYAITREPYFTCLALQGVILLFVVGLILRAAWYDEFRLARAIVVMAVLSCSKAFVDFSTSGLENPLSHLLLVGFVWAILADRPRSRGRSLLPAALAGLAAVNRLDAVLLVAPAMFISLVDVKPMRQRLHTLGWYTAGFGVPLLAWLSFATVYYGCPFPNTAYAKLSTGISAVSLIRHGLSYLRNSIQWDPITLGGIAIAAAPAVRMFWSKPPDRSRTAANLAAALACGSLLYIAYVVKVGGDFMSGRFFSMPLISVAAVFILAGPPLVLKRALQIVAAVLLIGALMPRSPLCSGRSYGGWRGVDPRAGLVTIDYDGIADERGFYFPGRGLISTPPEPSRVKVLDDLDWEDKGRNDAKLPPASGVSIVNAVGIRAFFGGPHIHYLDPYALGDPLLSRLPQEQGDTWRIGHFKRAIPLGYFQTIASGGQNRIVDVNLATLFDDVALATRAPLMSVARWGAIARLSLGYDNRLVDQAWYRNPALQPFDAPGRPADLWTNDVALPPPQAGTRPGGSRRSSAEPR